MFELSGVNYEEVLEQGDSILVRVIASSSYREFELSGVRVIGIILYIITSTLYKGNFPCLRQNIYNYINLMQTNYCAHTRVNSIKERTHSDSLIHT